MFSLFRSGWSHHRTSGIYFSVVFVFWNIWEYNHKYKRKWMNFVCGPSTNMGHRNVRNLQWFQAVFVEWFETFISRVLRLLQGQCFIQKSLVFFCVAKSLAMARFWCPYTRFLNTLDFKIFYNFCHNTHLVKVGGVFLVFLSEIPEKMYDPVFPSDCTLYPHLKERHLLLFGNISCC